MNEKMKDAQWPAYLCTSKITSNSAARAADYFSLTGCLGLTWRTSQGFDGPIRGRKPTEKRLTVQAVCEPDECALSGMLCQQPPVQDGLSTNVVHGHVTQILTIRSTQFVF